MKKTFLAGVMLSIVFSACKSEKKVEAQEAQEVTQEVTATAVDYNADTEATVIAWKGAHLGGIAPHNGTVKIKEGNITVENDKIVGGKFIIDFTTITNEDLADDSGKQAKLMGHIKSAEILNVEKFPEAAFEITSVETGEGDFNSKVIGNLTFLGVTKSITFLANISIADGKIDLNSDRFIIDRTQWGLAYGSASDEELAKMDESAKSKLISNDVEFQVNVIAKK
ncbi:MAG: YceI family protein [Flavobacteriales bacterium]